MVSAADDEALACLAGLVLALLGKVTALGNVFFDGSTLNAPEKVSIANPTPGIWTANIQGFAINSIFDLFNSDIWTLRATANGVRLAPVP